MASRAANHGADWKAAFRKSLARSAQLTGAVVLYGFTLFLAIALLSYTQTDPSLSTAAGDVVDNWMGKPGAFVADLALTAFGWVSVLFLPLTYVFARKLWRDADEEESWGGNWWRTVAIMLLAMALLSTAFSLITDPRDHSWPAGFGGLAGLLGEGGVRALAGLLPESGRFWAILAGGALSLIGGAVLAGRIFALDWSRFLSIPEWIKNPPQLTKPANPFQKEAKRKQRRKPDMRTADGDDSETDEDDDIPALAKRRPTEISDPAAPPRRAKPAPKAAQKDMFAEYDLPSIELLEDTDSGNTAPLDKLALERNARLLENVLDDFNVKGEITAVKTGPVVTMYELEPAPGIKASRVIGLAEDIARNMSAISARVAPIPGKTVMGIELPNADRQMVSFKELVESEAYVNNKGSLPIILGKGISGDPIVADLAAMPHLLVAGTTGAGKSVGLNAILLSLLYRFTPEECRMILIDPKVLELKSYEHIPHLLAEVVTEPPKAVRALKWAVEEMERRYRQMSDVGARNLAGFNDRVRAAAAKGKPLQRTVQTGFDPETGEAIIEEELLEYEVLPQIVVIVDELADLMLVVGKEIEGMLQRLCQKSRAAGIHVITATQRPSVDVITGVIKANLPTRISFAVSSRIDSRTIIGEQGAEQLLGKGDMLYKPLSGQLTRVHGPFVSDEEVEKVAEHWRQQGAPQYIDSVTEEPEEGGFTFEDEFTASDNPEERKYRQACQMVIENQKASGSWLQRQMKVGYNTAANWIERMESEGLVGPANHVGRRDIYRDKDGNPI
ncbi:FtsK/SpoIIIE family DNA translocase [Aurantiacibacter sp. MUD61]|uniref:FtsK/SpoIIIE family DNA translocase n=1 Tax=Aurantiacibacter sp. MUD61 TaxID=3009083 RepID=UPI0022F0A3AA|nr:DNA translocase FtsK 4TM domain-containing protein [Aurantiacibacter sp. MUD61]